MAYLSTFYTRFDLAVRIGLFYGMYAVAGAFSGSICTSPSAKYIMCVADRVQLMAFFIYSTASSRTGNFFS